MSVSSILVCHVDNTTWRHPIQGHVRRLGWKDGALVVAECVASASRTSKLKWTLRERGKYEKKKQERKTTVLIKLSKVYYDVKQVTPIRLEIRSHLEPAYRIMMLRIYW